MNSKLRRFGSEESGQTLVEYALILMLVAFLTFASVTSIGTTVANFLSDAAAALGGG